MDIKIGVVTGCSQFADIAKEIASELSINTVIIPYVLEEAVPKVKEEIDNGLDVVITRGGTSAILKKETNVPVLSVPITAFDILRALKQAKNFGNKIGFATYGSPLNNLDLFEDLFGIEIRQITYNKNSDIRNEIERLLRDGIEVVVGWNLTFNTAITYGMKAVLLTTDKESLSETFKEATNIVMIQKKDKERTRLLQTILDVEHRGVISINQNGIVTIFNKSAQELLDINIKDITGKPISAFIKNSVLERVIKDGIMRNDKLDMFNHIPLVINASPIHMNNKIIGAVATFDEASKITEAERRIRKAKTKRFLAKYSVDHMIGKSEGVKNVRSKAKKFANSDSTILITGETGTGKEILAHSIHRLSRRCSKPFLVINCSALPESLLESELFGYEEGSFTGAKRGGKTGLFELAHEGTIFLDEIGSISQLLQSRLLRVLQEKEVLRIGGDRVIPVDVRIIAATNRNLLEEIKKGSFREDLYFRLNILSIRMPPLMERIEDIPIITKYLIKKYCDKYRKKYFYFSNEIMRDIVKYSWPGNVRELENFIERCALLKDDLVDSEKIFRKLFKEITETTNYLQDESNDNIQDQNDDVLLFSLREVMKNWEKQLLTNTLVVNRGIMKKEVAKKLGISRATLWRKTRDRDGL